jgi:serine/threonine protein kinase
MEKDAIELVAAMISKDPTKRLTPAEVKAHPWMQGRVAT